MKTLRTIAGALAVSGSLFLPSAQAAPLEGCTTSPLVATENRHEGWYTGYCSFIPTTSDRVYMAWTMPAGEWQWGYTVPESSGWERYEGLGPEAGVATYTVRKGHPVEVWVSVECFDLPAVCAHAGAVTLRQLD